MMSGFYKWYNVYPNLANNMMLIRSIEKLIEIHFFLDPVTWTRAAIQPFMSPVLMYSFMRLTKQALFQKTNYWFNNQRIKVILCYFHLRIPSLNSAVINVCEQWSTSKRKTQQMQSNTRIVEFTWNAGTCKITVWTSLLKYK